MLLLDEPNFNHLVHLLGSEYADGMELGEGLNAHGLWVDHEVEGGITRLVGLGILFDVKPVYSVDLGLD